MVLLSRNKQLLFEIETVPGTAVNVSSSSTAIRVLDAQIQIAPEKIDDDAASPSIGSQPVRSGVRQGTITFDVEISGIKGGGGSGLPPWNTLMLSSGKVRQTIQRVLVTGFSTGKVFKQGLSFEGDTSGGRGVVAKTIYDRAAGQPTDLELFYYIEPGQSADIDNTDTTLELEDVGGDFNSNAVTVSSQTPAAVGHGYFDVSRGVYGIDVDAVPAGGWDAGDVLQGVTSGAVVRVFEASAAAATDIRYELLYGSALVDTETITNLTKANNATAASAQRARAGYTVTMGMIEDGLLKELRGCRGEVQLVATAGRAARLRFTYQGVLNRIVDAGPYAVTIDGGATPPRFVNATIWAGANDGDGDVWTPILNELNVTVGQALAMREDATSSEGITEALAGRRAITGTVDPESAPEAVFDFYAKTTGATDFPVMARWGTTGSFNAFLVQFDRTIVRESNSGDRGGKQTEQANFEAFEYRANDAMVFLVL